MFGVGRAGRIETPQAAFLERAEDRDRGWGATALDGDEQAWPMGADDRGLTRAAIAHAERGVMTSSGEIADVVVVAARRGDHEAFAAIVEHYDDRLRALAYHILRDADDLDDTMQEAYVKAYRGLRSFRGSSALGTWLYRITYTTCLNVARARSRRPISSNLDYLERVGGGVDSADEVAGLDAFGRLLAGLPLEQRAVVLLIDARGHTYADASEILGIPPGTVASRLSAAHSRLRAVLDAESAIGSVGAEVEMEP
jgi:RNA polymerase sigma-70 factor, ECF subfamily